MVRYNLHIWLWDCLAMWADIGVGTVMLRRNNYSPFQYLTIDSRSMNVVLFNVHFKNLDHLVYILYQLYYIVVKII